MNTPSDNLLLNTYFLAQNGPCSNNAAHILLGETDTKQVTN